MNTIKKKMNRNQKQKNGKKDKLEWKWERKRCSSRDFYGLNNGRWVVVVAVVVVVVIESVVSSFA